MIETKEFVSCNLSYPIYLNLNYSFFVSVFLIYLINYILDFCQRRVNFSGLYRLLINRVLISDVS
jgi:hypothetical protein